MNEQTEHQQYANSLRAIADWIEAHPEVAIPSDNSLTIYSMDTKDEAATLVRAMGSCNKRYDDSYLTVEKSFGPIRLRAVFSREQVCKRVVVGVETIPAEFVEARTRPAHTKEIVKWECEPILAPTEGEPKEPHPGDAHISFE